MNDEQRAFLGDERRARPCHLPICCSVPLATIIIGGVLLAQYGSAADADALAALSQSAGSTHRSPSSRHVPANGMHLAHSVEALAARSTRLLELKNKWSPSCWDQSEESTYGGITPSGMSSMLRSLPKVCALTPASVFADVGSGLGSVPIFVRAATGVRSLGIELSACRHAIASARLRAVSTVRTLDNHSTMGAGVSFVRGDVTVVGLAGVTHLFMHSTCFGAPLLHRIAELAKGAGTRCILAAGHDDISPNLTSSFGPAIGVTKASLTWAAGGMPLYYYARQDLARGLPPVSEQVRRTWRDRAQLELARQHRESEGATLGRRMQPLDLRRGRRSR